MPFAVGKNTVTLCTKYHVNLICCQGLLVLVNSLPRVEEDVDSWLKVAHRLFVAKHDVAEDVANLAAELWTKANMEVRQ